jgi:hypothetical protein
MEPALPIDLGDVPEELHDCTVGRIRDLNSVDHPANSIDWSDGGSSQSYQVYRCRVCGDYWGVRFQYDAGTGHDDRWHRFGDVNPTTIKRHY